MINVNDNNATSSVQVGQTAGGLWTQSMNEWSCCLKPLCNSGIDIDWLRTFAIREEVCLNVLIGLKGIRMHDSIYPLRFLADTKRIKCQVSSQIHDTLGPPNIFRSFLDGHALESQGVMLLTFLLCH